MPAPATAILSRMEFHPPSARRIMEGLRSGNEHALPNEVVDTSPANRVAREAGDPDAESDRVPNGNERQFAPNVRLFHPVNADEPSHGETENGVSSEVGACDGEGRMGGNSDQ